MPYRPDSKTIHAILNIGDQKTMIILNKTIRLFLDSIGRREEYEFYLGKFHSEHTACFALLCPDLGSIEEGAGVLAFDLQFLMRLELVPTLLLCNGQAERMQLLLAGEPIFGIPNAWRRRCHRVHSEVASGREGPRARGARCILG